MFLTTKEICLTSIFVAITAILSQISFPVGPIPFSMSVFSVYLSGLILSPKCAFISQCIYLLLGVAGLPIFSGFSGGIGFIFGPTAGYLVTYPLMAFLIAKIVKVKFNPVTVVFALVMALGLCYIGGTIWFSFYMKLSFLKALSIAVYPFVLMDIIKIAICTICIIPLKNRISKL